MTVQWTVRCNLCGDVIDANCEGYGVHFRSGGIDLKNIHETEHHLCTDCVSHLMTTFDGEEDKSETTSERQRQILGDPVGGVSFSSDKST